jgi:CRP-like cAMP-binding protein
VIPNNANFANGLDSQPSVSRSWQLPSTLAWTATSLGAGEVLYREGSSSSRLFSVKSGIVKVVAHLPSGRVRILGLHGRGAILGLETPASQSDTYNHTAIAITEAECSWAPASQLRRLRHQRSEEYLSLVERYCEELKHSERWITEFSADTTTSRIARVIKYLAELQELGAPPQVELLTCQEMAEVIGASTESASRVLAKFKRQGVLKPVADDASHRLYHFDAAAIERMALA